MDNPTPNEVNEATATPIDGEPQDEMPEAAADAPDLSTMTRAELNAHATEQGIENPEGYANKGELIAALSGEGAGDGDGEAPAAEPMRFRVLKAVTLDDGRTVMPGESLEIAPDDASWPARRPKQLVGQKYLRPMNDTAKDATRGSDDDA